MKKLFYILTFFMLLTSCEKDISIDIDSSDPKVVVEGYIENDVPPYVILTKSSPFFDPITIEDFENSFIHGALVVVNNGTTSDTLFEVATDTLNAFFRDFITDSLDLDITFGEPGEATYYFYTTLSMIGEIGRSYDLTISTLEGDNLNATTTLPNIVPLDSIWMTPHPDEEADTLYILNTRYTDEANVENYARYFTKRNSEPYYTSYFQSVVDDKSYLNINGETIDFTLERGQDRNAEFEGELYSYFTEGDTISLKWSNIDEAHYNFWVTLEFDRNGQGNPYHRPTVIQSNVNGGLGVWGGYTSTYQSIIVE